MGFRECAAGHRPGSAPTARVAPVLRRIVRSAAETVLLRFPTRVTPDDRLALAYHNVVPAHWRGDGDRSLHLPVDQFERQLDVLQRDFDVVPLMELLHDTPRESPAGSRVAITFDDAYGSALTLGVATCANRGLPCTVFVAPALLGTIPVWDQRAASGRWSAQDRETFLSNERGRGAAAVPAAADPVLTIASREELCDWSSRLGGLVTFGNHTDTHPNLGALSDTEVRAELDRCDQWLRENVSARHVPVVAYPYGLAPTQPEAAVPSNAATFGMRVSGGWLRAGMDAPAHAIPRWNVPAGISLNGFRLRLRGRLLGD